MKKIVLLLTILVSGMFSFQSVSAGVVNTCDQTFYGELRHGKGYNFGDIFTNDTSSQVWLRNYWTDFEYQKDYNLGSADPEFPWTSWIVNKSHSLQPGEEGEVVKSTPQYNILTSPPTRNNKNLVVKYKAEYFKAVGGQWTGPFYHTECKNYTITSCGDGVKDSGYEECDGTQGINPDTQTCNSSCEIVENPVLPVCNSISPSNVTGGELSTNGTFTTQPISCNVSNSSGHDIKVNCGNGTTVNSGQSCTYNREGTFSASCMIDGVDAGTQCYTSVFTVTKPSNPAYIVAKVDFNYDDNDGTLGDIRKNDTADDSQTVNIGDDAVFKIYVRNVGDVTLTNVKITDPLTPSCDRVIGSLLPGEFFPPYTCTKTNVQKGTFPQGVNTVILSSNELPNKENSSQVIIDEPNCLNLTVNNGNSNIAPSNSSFTCRGENNDNFTVKYSLNGNVIKTFSTNGYQGTTFSGNLTGLTEGNYTVNCTVDNQPQQDKCSESFTITKPKTPNIGIEKTAIDGTENQTILSGGQAGFKIKVTNTGETNLAGPFTLTDPKVTSGNCSGVVRLPGTKPQTFGEFKITGAGNHTDAILQIGESFEYICYEDDVIQSTFNGVNTVSVSAPTVPTVNNETYIDIIDPVCNNVTVENTTRVVPFESGKIVCSGNSTNFSDYTITILQDGDVVKTVNSKETTFSFTEVAEYEVKCSVNGATSNACSVPVITNAGTTPEISLIKTDYNDGNDYDSRSDYQEVAEGTEAVFKITVSNTGKEDLKDLVLSDTTNTPVNGQTDYTNVCGGSVDLSTKKLASGQDIIYTGTGPNLKVGESFYYICTIDNTTNGYTNNAEVTANSVVDGESVDAEDPSYVTTGTYDLALVKTVLTEASVFQKGGTVEYEIIVENQGTIDAEGVTVTDYIPEGMKLNDSNWTLDGNKATRNVGNVAAGETKSVVIILEIEAESGTIINWAEISGTTDGNVDCDSTPDNDQTNDDYTTDFGTSTNPDGCNENDGDEDDHDPATILVSKYDLALIKTVVDPQDEYLPGSTVTFKIDVINQGTIAANDVVVTDYFPTTLELIDTTWTNNGNTATKVVGEVKVGESESVTIEFKVLATASGNIINTAEISSDDGIDCDSTADSANNNTDGEKVENIIDDAVGTGCEPDGDEDDHDIAVITTPVSEGGKIKIEKYSNQGQTDQDDDKTRLSTDDNQLINSGDTAKFNIRVTNEGTVDLINVVVTDSLTGTTCDKTIESLIVDQVVEYECIRENATEDYINSVSVVATDKTTNLPITPDENDTNTTDVKVVPGSELLGKIKIEKYSNQGTTDQDDDKSTLESDDEQLINSGDTAKFNIRVTNEGPVDLINVFVTDSLTGTTCNKTIESLIVDQVVEYECIRENATEDYTNSVSVVATDKTTNLPITPDENDTDTTKVIVDGTSNPISGKIKIEKYSNQGTTDQDDDKSTLDTDDEQLINSGETAKFNIRVTNEGTEDLINVVITDSLTGTTCNKTIELLIVDQVVEYTCIRDNATTPYTNSVSVVATNKGTGLAVTPDENDTDTTEVKIKSTSSGGSNGGSGSSPVCYNIEQSGNQYTCTVNKKTYTSGTAGIDCHGDGSYEEIATKANGRLVQNTTTGRYEFTVTCSPKDNGDGTVTAVAPQCDVQTGSVAVNQSNGWGTVAPQCKLTTPEFCGNGKVEPNNNEQCDGGDSCYAPGHAKECTLKSRSHTSTKEECSDPAYEAANKIACGIETYPTGGSLKFTALSNFAISTQDIFEDKGDKYGFTAKNHVDKYIEVTNDGTEAIYLDDTLCIMDRGSLVTSGKTDIIGGSSDDLFCESHTIDWVFPGETRYFKRSGLSMTGYPDNLTSGYKSETSNLVVTIRDSAGETYEWSPILSGDMYITVGKPGIEADSAVPMVYIKDAAKLSSISKIAEAVNNNGPTNISTEQENFVAAVLGGGSDLSALEVNSSQLDDKAEDEGAKISSIVDEGIVPDAIVDAKANGDLTSFTPDDNLDGGVIVKDTNIVLGTHHFTERGTYTIENGNLIISGDITTDENIGFIVNNGDIIVNDNVVEMMGTYVLKGGKYTVNKANDGTLISTNNVLKHGQMFGNDSELTKHRTNVEMDVEGNVKLGRLLVFSSNIFNQPAPGISSAVAEFDSVEAQKIAQ